MATYHRQQGKKVRIFKTGPDFIDPMILEQASGHAVYQLDLWMVGKAQCQALIFEAATTADLILIEGVMGLFDGTPSTADLSEFFNIPVLAVIDGSAMAQTFGALALGLQQYRPELKIAGVIANKIAGEKHGQMILNSMPSSITNVDYILAEPKISLAERHLGLIQASELHDIQEKLAIAAGLISKSILTELPAPIKFLKPEDNSPTLQSYEFAGGAVKQQPLINKRIIVAKDLSFNFLYQANLQLLEQAGAKLLFSSPLNDQQLPEGDALYLPGGYPELYVKQLSENLTYIKSVQQFAKSNKPILAECGGMLYLLDSLTTTENRRFSMAQVIPGDGVMKNKLSAIGQQYANLSNFCILSDHEKNRETVNNNEIRGHSFHYSQAKINLPISTRTKYYPYQTDGEAIYLIDNILASYMHWYFPSNPQFIFDFFNQQLQFKVEIS